MTKPVATLFCSISARGLSRVRGIASHIRALDEHASIASAFISRLLAFPLARTMSARRELFVHLSSAGAMCAASPGSALLQPALMPVRPQIQEAIVEQARDEAIILVMFLAGGRAGIGRGETWPWGEQRSSLTRSLERDAVNETHGC